MKHSRVGGAVFVGGTGGVGTNARNDESAVVSNTGISSISLLLWLMRIDDGDGSDDNDDGILILLMDGNT